MCLCGKNICHSTRFLMNKKIKLCENLCVYVVKIFAIPQETL
jgi:hypothetical protein